MVGANCLSILRRCHEFGNSGNNYARINHLPLKQRWQCVHCRLNVLANVGWCDATCGQILSYATEDAELAFAIVLMI